MGVVLYCKISRKYFRLNRIEQTKLCFFCSWVGVGLREVFRPSNHIFFYFLSIVSFIQILPVAVISRLHFVERTSPQMITKIKQMLSSRYLVIILSSIWSFVILAFSFGNSNIKVWPKFHFDLKKRLFRVSTCQF